MSITEIQTAVSQLSQDELAEFIEWLDEFQESQWDKQIQEDLEAGRLEPLIKQAEQAFSDGKCRQI